jgi:hypothetical protein
MSKADEVATRLRNAMRAEMQAGFTINQTASATVRRDT